MFDHPNYKAQEIISVTMALLYESTGQDEKALEKWEAIQTKEAREHTINILKKAGLKAWVKDYGSWVLKQDPELFLTLFKRD